MERSRQASAHSAGRHLRRATHAALKQKSPPAGPPEIALTFDDGPWPYYTDRVLETLRQFGIHATFFVIGRQAAAYPDLVRAAAFDGNEVENHTWNHADLRNLSPDGASAEIASTAAEVLLLTGRAPHYLRPPYGDVSARVHGYARALGEDTILWNVDPRDWSRPGTWYIENNVLTNVHARSIILMHDGGGLRDETIAALQQIIPTLQARGYRFVTVQQLMDPAAPMPFPLGHLRTQPVPGLAPLRRQP